MIFLVDFYLKKKQGLWVSAILENFIPPTFFLYAKKLRRNIYTMGNNYGLETVAQNYLLRKYLCILFLSLFKGTSRFF